jgi:hypothetical protein
MHHKDAMYMITAVRNSSYKPNDWEANFMTSIESSNQEVLTYKQHCAVEKLYRNAFGGGQYQKRKVV